MRTLNLRGQTYPKSEYKERAVDQEPCNPNAILAEDLDQDLYSQVEDRQRKRNGPKRGAGIGT